MISSDASALVRQLFLNSNILSLPTGDSIKGWEHGLDGITYFIEHFTKDGYSFKSYWIPKAQKNLIEAIQVQQFVDNAFLLVDAENVWKSFTKKIPYESYYNEGPSTTVRILTNEQREKYAKERKKYRKKMHLQ